MTWCCPRTRKSCVWREVGARERLRECVYVWECVLHLNGFVVWMELGSGIQSLPCCREESFVYMFSFSCSLILKSLSSQIHTLTLSFSLSLTISPNAHFYDPGHVLMTTLFPHLFLQYPLSKFYKEKEQNKMKIGL